MPEESLANEEPAYADPAFEDVQMDEPDRAAHAAPAWDRPADDGRFAGSERPTSGEQTSVWDEPPAAPEPEPSYERPAAQEPTYQQPYAPQSSYERPAGPQSDYQRSYDPEPRPTYQQPYVPEPPRPAPSRAPEPTPAPQSAPAKQKQVDPELALVDVVLLDMNFSDGDHVDLEVLKRRGLAMSNATRLKVRASGKMRHALTVVANQFTYDAIFAIGAAGGEAQYIR